MIGFTSCVLTEGETLRYVKDNESGELEQVYVDTAKHSGDVITWTCACGYTHTGTVQ